MRHRVPIVVWLLALGLTQVAMLQAEEKKTQLVTLVGDPWPPYFLGEPGKEATGGVAVHLMHTIFDRVDGARLSIPLVPWNRALREVELGTKDGIAILLKTPEREEYMEYTNEVFRSHNSVWYVAGSFPNGLAWQRYADFEPYTIGIIRGHSYGDEFDQLISDGTLTAIRVSSARQLFAMLEKGRIDLAIANRMVGAAFVEECARSGKRLLSTSRPAATEVYYIAFSKKSEARHFIPALNRVISELKNEGVIQRLVEDSGGAAELPDDGRP